MRKSHYSGPQTIGMIKEQGRRTASAGSQQLKSTT
ncbi:hypothetical protein JSE7799_02637 [Jannaschia seosinensis]|uniref:Uncharacterized protein n=1 Tax=Jannaschia seosinensis TaxID=313367 RepID=A0A0M7BCJ1_9RHOB|nr:hypothetical protein JSE7799_02637 [Jannaschia seosinensis]